MPGSQIGGWMIFWDQLRNQDEDEEKVAVELSNEENEECICCWLKECQGVENREGDNIYLLSKIKSADSC